MPYMKRVYRDKKASVHLSAARNERVLLVAVINRLLTAGFVPYVRDNRLLTRS